MKLLNKIAFLINKLDSKLFGRKVAYQPLSGNAFIDVLITSIAVGIILAIVQIVTKGRDTEEIVGVAGGIIILLAMLRRIWPNLKSPILGVGTKIGIVLFNLFLVGISIQLAMWIVMLILAIFVLYIILCFVGGSSSSSGARKGSNTSDDCYYCRLHPSVMGKRMCTKGYGDGSECNSYQDPSSCPYFLER